MRTVRGNGTRGHTLFHSSLTTTLVDMIPTQAVDKSQPPLPRHPVPASSIATPVHKHVYPDHITVVPATLIPCVLFDERDEAGQGDLVLEEGIHYGSSRTAGAGGR